MGHFLYNLPRFSAAACIASEWRISLRFFDGDLSLPCGIALSGLQQPVQNPKVDNNNYPWL